MAATKRFARRDFALLWLPALIFVLTGCSSVDDPNSWTNYTVMEHLTSSKPPQAAPASLSRAEAMPAPQVAVLPAGQQAAIMPPPNVAADAEFYRSELSCGGVAPNAARGMAGPPASAISSIAFEMTECDVVRRVGAPDKVDLGSSLRGERVLTMTYSRGERPRIYRFAGGRLIGTEIVPSHQPVGAKRR